MTVAIFMQLVRSWSAVVRVRGRGDRAYTPFALPSTLHLSPSSRFTPPSPFLPFPSFLRASPAPPVCCAPPNGAHARCRAPNVCVVLAPYLGRTRARVGVIVSTRHLRAARTNFFTQRIHRITSPTYVPSEEDVLRARARSTAIIETRF
ncbi:hypothetical protein B0H16DRAFT_1780818 [Mycena metata]|uniref:Uncharacterized protein n=1 Tax=Mycena metata TaxID=1033252 RepID=A0AAD7NNB6_9AGAR|nr:hypothetical protein B0H16DRAFT_1780818 [Mycena metata]